MNKIFLTAILIGSSLALFSQNRIMTISNGLAKVGQSKIQITTFLKNKGFKIVISNNDCSSYSLLNNGVRRTITVCYKNSKVSAIAWNEDKEFMNLAMPEIQAERFSLKTEDPYYVFVNPTTKRQLSLMNRVNDVFISIGTL